jgi:hypothetical protein
MERSAFWKKRFLAPYGVIPSEFVGPSLSQLRKAIGNAVPAQAGYVSSLRNSLADSEIMSMDKHW